MSKIDPIARPDIGNSESFDETVAGKKPILLKGGELDRAVTEAAAALRDRLYLRGNQLVRIARPQGHDPSGTGEALAADLQPVDRDRMRVELARVVCFYRIGKYGPYDVNPPGDMAAAVIAAADTLGFRPLRGVVTAPLIRRDGSLAATPGYDPASELYFDIPRGAMAGLNLQPSRADAAQAVQTLADLIAEFPFVEQADRSVVFTAILTTLQRPVLPTAMMPVLDSPTPGTGKTKLTTIASVIGTGTRPAVMSVSASEEETNKRLDAMLLSGRTVLVLDNIDAPLGGDRLCSLLSEPRVAIRRLGVSEVTSVPVTCTVMANGNNIRLKGDVTRRALIARLDAQVERPELRSFTRDPVAEAQKNRWAYVRAAMTIILAYQHAGCPPVARPIGNFETWCHMVRDPLVWAGCTDPAATMERLREDDPLRGDLEALLEAWHAHFGNEAKLVGDVIRAAQTRQSPLADALEAVALVGGSINRRRQGHYLKANLARVVGGRKFVDDGKRNGSKLWKVVAAD